MWPQIKDMYEGKVLATGNPCTVDDVIIAIRHFKAIGNDFIEPGKGCAAAADVVCSVVDRLEGRFAPAPMSLLQVYQNEPPATDAVRQESNQRIRTKLAIGGQDRHLYQVLPLGTVHELHEALHTYYIIGVLGGKITL